MTFGQKINGLTYHKKPSVYAVILNSSKLKVLAVQTANKHYFLPGGEIEHNESIYSCLKRELLEETGFEIKHSEFVGKAQRYFIAQSGEPILNDAHFFHVKKGMQTQEPTELDHKPTLINIDLINQYLVHNHQAWAVHECLKING